MARGKKPDPSKKVGRQPESLAATPPLKGKPPVTKPQNKKKTSATGDPDTPPPPATGASPTPKLPNSYAAAAKPSMDTSEPMDIEQLCAMRPQRSGTPPRSNQGPPPSAATTNPPKTNLPGQGPPPKLATQGASAVLASPPSSSLAAAAAGGLPAAAKSTMVISAAGLKAGAAPAGLPQNPPSAQKAPLHHQQLQTVVESPAAKNLAAMPSTTASQLAASAPTKEAPSTPAALSTATATPQAPSAGTSSKPHPAAATTTVYTASAPAPTLKAPLSCLNKTYFDIQIPLTPRGELTALAIQHLCLEEFITSI